MVGRNVSHFSCSVLNISKKHCPTILLYDSLGKLQVISFITLECKMTVNFHLLSIKQASECNELCTLNGNIHFLFTILCFWHSNILEFPLWTDWIVIHHGFIYAVWKTKQRRNIKSLWFARPKTDFPDSYSYILINW